MVLGPSGCGKSTALRLVAGLEVADAGDADGQRVNDVPADQRSIAMVFQNYALLPHLTVRDNIEFGLKVRRVPAKERATKLERAADQLGLCDQLASVLPSSPAARGSGVALGRALVSDSSLVLMDEPLSNLDAKLLRQQMRLELRAVQRDSASPSCTSPTIRSRRWPWRPWSWSSGMADSSSRLHHASCTAPRPRVGGRRLHRVAADAWTTHQPKAA